jgi:hypothetical protein
MEQLADCEQLNKLSDAVKQKYTDVFLPIPHIDSLLTNVYCCIKLKDASKTFATWSYATSQKYKEAWATLIQQHLNVGHIRPSNSEHVLLAFIISKADTTVLPCCVNDYHTLNSNTVTDTYLLLRIDDILMDCAKGKIWGKSDVTNSFFQKCVHLDNIHFTTITMPLELYE